MIQRKQSIFIGISIVFSFFLFLLPTVNYSVGNEIVRLSLNPLSDLGKSTNWVYLLFVFNLLFFATSFSALFMFKNRKKQIKICSYSIISSILLLIGFLTFPLNQSHEIVKQFNWPISLIPISIILLLIAIRFIKQDEELVRSADRIR